MTDAASPAEEAGSETESKEARLSKKDWEEISTLWELGEIKLSEICRRWKISKQAVIRYFKRNGIVQNSRKSEVKTAVIAGVAAATAAAAVPTFADKRKQRIEETRESHYQAADYLTKLTTKTLIDAVRDKKPLASVREDLKALRYASAIHETMLRIRLDVLNAHDEIDEVEMPSFQIVDLTDKDIEELRAKQDEEDMGDDGLLETFEETDEEEDDD